MSRPLAMSTTDRARNTLIRHGDLGWHDANACVEQLQDAGLLAADPPRCSDPAPNDAGLGSHAVTCSKNAGHEYDQSDPNAEMHEGPPGWLWPSSSGRSADGLPRAVADGLTDPIAELSGVPEEYVRRVLRALLSVRGAFAAAVPAVTHVTVDRTMQYGVELTYEENTTRFVELEDSRDRAVTLAESPANWDPPGPPGVVHARTITTVTGGWTPIHTPATQEGAAAA